MTPDSQLEVWIDAARSGDRLALAKLLAALHPKLRARIEAGIDPAIKVRSGPDDILQEVYLQVFRRIDRFEDRGLSSFLSWLNTILDNKLSDARRAAHRRVRDVAREVPAAASLGTRSYWNLFDQLYADSDSPSRAVRRDEALGALLTCLADLSEDHRQVIQLRFLDGLSVAQVASRVDRSEAAVVALTKRSLEALREAMDRLGEFTHGA